MFAFQFKISLLGLVSSALFLWRFLHKRFDELVGAPFGFFLGDTVAFLKTLM